MGLLSPLDQTRIDIEALQAAFDVIEARRILEPQLCATVILKARKSDLLALRSREKPRSLSPKTWLVKDLDFRTILVTLVDNPLISNWMDTIVRQEVDGKAGQALHPVLQANFGTAQIQYHLPLVDALIARHPDRAMEIIRDHFTLVERGLRHTLSL